MPPTKTYNKIDNQTLEIVETTVVQKSRPLTDLKDEIVMRNQTIQTIIKEKDDNLLEIKAQLDAQAQTRIDAEQAIIDELNIQIAEAGKLGIT